MILLLPFLLESAIWGLVGGVGRDPSTYIFTCISYFGFGWGWGGILLLIYIILVERDPSTYIFT